ncbi:MAG TPA: hypothetical protein VD838_04145 [Anaeromyxobacteraceae bacterium]|nr:hypothetical protein [Anaeromyxobacteraceae bacterium]
MPSPVLAFRPATVTARLPARNEACPLSPRDVLDALAAGGGPLLLPMVRAPIAGVARGALVACREAGSALALALPPGVPPEGWFDAVVEAADAGAAGLPIVLAGEIRVGGEGEAAVERAVAEAWRLAGAGLTHLAVDVGPVAAAARARAFAEVARAAVEHGLGVECLVPQDAEAPAAEAAALVERLAALRVPVDVVGVRLAAPADDAAAREQARRLGALSAALGGTPMARRGPVTPEAVTALVGGPVWLVEDGGAAAAAALRVLPWELLEEGGPAGPRTGALERAAAALDAEAADRLEALAYVEALELVEALGARGSAARIVGALARRRGEDR